MTRANDALSFCVRSRLVCVLLSLAIVTTITPSAFAAPCSNPDGVEGEIVYNTTYKVAQFCNGTHWIGMGMNDTSGPDSDTLASLGCTTGQVPKWSGVNWACSDDDGGATAAGGAGQIQFNDGSNNLAADSRLYWDNASKRLGIGTTAPATALHIESASNNGTDVLVKNTGNGPNAYAGVFVENDANAYGGIWVASSTTSTSYRQNRLVLSIDENAVGLDLLAYTPGSDIRFHTGNHSYSSASERMRITANGDVGIGTLTPQSKLHVAGSIQLGDDTAACPGTSNVKLGTLRVNGGALQLCGADGWTAIGSGGGVPAGTIAAFATTSCPTGWTEYVAARGRFLRGIDNGAGNDPSGTRAPGNVQADDIKAIPNPYLWNAAGYNGGMTPGGAFSGRLASQATPSGWPNGNETRPKNVAVLFCQYTGAGGGGGSATAAGDAGQLQFNDGANNLAADTTLYWDNSNKRLGIGTTSPSEKLDVNGTVKASRVLVGPSGEALLAYYNPSAEQAVIVSNRNDDWGDSLRIGPNYYYMYSGGIIAMTLNNGKVGIGTTSISYKLQVAGQVAGAGAYVNTSDARLKKNVRDLDYGLDTVMRLRPVSFQWKDQKEDWQKGRKLGLIAQEVETIAPEIVSTASDAAHTKSIAYGDLVPVLIKAVQELNIELKAANDNYIELRREIDTLKAAK